MGSHPCSAQNGKRILFVGTSDPFTNNLIELLKQHLHADVGVVYTDDAIVGSNLVEVCSIFDAIIIGPGGGRAINQADVGFVNKLWKLEGTQIIPILGIGLGFQSLCHSHGAEVVRLRSAHDGILSRITHKSADIFSGIGDFYAAQYRPVHVNLGRLSNNRGSGDAVHWEPTSACPLLEPLAWNNDDDVNGPMLMAVRHTSKPFWGVQFHPESIYASEAGKELIGNWWRCAVAWRYERGLRPKEGVRSIPTKFADLESASPERVPNRLGGRLAQELREIAGIDNMFLRWGKYRTAYISPVELVESLGYSQQEVIVLDSQDHAPGRYSIIGIAVPGKTMMITYNVSNRILKYGLSGGNMSTTQLNSIEEAWPILQGVLDVHSPSNHTAGTGLLTLGLDTSRLGIDQCVRGHLPTESPFWGGLMGYVSYEAGLETIGVSLHESCAANGVPDINYAFIHRSIVIDHGSNEVYTQTLLPGDWKWILDVRKTIIDITTPPTLSGAAPFTSQASGARDDLREKLAAASLHCPSEMDYRGKILRCQESLAAGGSHELYLTEESKVMIPYSRDKIGIDAWALYKRLRRHKPAPYGAFLRLSDVVVAGSSPESFLSWTRQGVLATANQLPRGSDERLMDRDSPRGIHAFKASLPPSSMAGAPKKKACEVLRNIEKRRRGVYSGVLGYIDIGGAGDFSVVARAAVREGKVPGDDHGFETWHVGAGSAVTAHSSDEDAFLEMEADASAVLSVFIQPRED
ncbi:ADC synthase [Nemania sp. FL0031]|nr:ADC synthase [Nemania sp. FL0031]